MSSKLLQDQEKGGTHQERLFNSGESETAQDSQKKKKQRMIIIIISAVAFLAVLGIVLFLVLKNGDEPNPPNPPDIVYVPYHAYLVNESNNTYRVDRNKDLTTFPYPFEETANNKFVDSMLLSYRNSLSGFHITFDSGNYNPFRLESSDPTLLNESAAPFHDDRGFPRSNLSIDIDTGKEFFFTVKDQNDQVLMSTVNQTFLMMDHY